ncbi:MAG: MOSC domain-containing protein [bacterium]|nr:MOSC domain-containing protein [bacterium]
MGQIKHLTTEELEAGLEPIRQSPRTDGKLDLIVRRPVTEERDVLEVGELNPAEGLAGDNWNTRPSARNAEGELRIDTQLTMMNSRAAALVSQAKDRWALTGDQLFVDLDLSEENLSPGTRLALGSAVIEITDVPHLGCKKFVARFGMDAMTFVNSPEGKALRLRGIYAKVVQPGKISAGDVIRKQ